jgi:hypothetical protein
LRYVKILRGEEEMVHIREPEIGRNLSDDEEKRSKKGLISCQVENGERSMDLIDYQESRSRLSSCQVGKGSDMTLVEGLMSSEVSSDQQGVLMERRSEDLMDSMREKEES